MFEFGAGLIVGAALLRLHQHLWATAPLRQSRYRMRAWLANAIYDGRVRPVQMKRSKRGR